MNNCLDSNQFPQENTLTTTYQGKDVHRSTVSRRLVHDSKLKACKPRKKLRLSEAMKAKRIAFAEAKWDQFLFSDESTVQRFVQRNGLLAQDKMTTTPKLR